MNGIGNSEGWHSEILVIAVSDFYCFGAQAAAWRSHWQASVPQRGLEEGEEKTKGRERKTQS